MGFSLGRAIGAKVGNTDKVVHPYHRGRLLRNRTAMSLTTVEHTTCPSSPWCSKQRHPGQGPSVAAPDLSGALLRDHPGPRGPDFVKLAEAYGLKGRRVTNRAEMEQALQGGPCPAAAATLIDCRVDMDDGSAHGGWRRPYH